MIGIRPKLLLLSCVGALSPVNRKGYIYIRAEGDFLERYTVEWASKAEIRHCCVFTSSQIERSEKAESCRKNLLNVIQSKGP